ncbi:hypothetical protein BJX63DRAFT_22954 [Aspergillus granulosus]|uniref:Uncharacterized protein n=1 Tax=Aspergillus granulosus TaxID=176169 RepID=A0ABR4GZX5_9EURO
MASREEGSVAGWTRSTRGMREGRREWEGGWIDRKAGWVCGRAGFLTLNARRAQVERQRRGGQKGDGLWEEPAARAASRSQVQNCLLPTRLHCCWGKALGINQTVGQQSVRGRLGKRGAPERAGPGRTTHNWPTAQQTGRRTLWPSSNNNGCLRELIEGLKGFLKPDGRRKNGSGQDSIQSRTVPWIRLCLATARTGDRVVTQVPPSARRLFQGLGCILSRLIHLAWSSPPPTSHRGERSQPPWTALNNTTAHHKSNTHPEGTDSSTLNPSRL